METGHFGPSDYVVIALMLVISTAIGLYYRLTGGRQQTTKEYLMAGKNMPIFPVSVSLMASYMSAVALLGITKEIYAYGTQFIMINVTAAIGTILTVLLYLPVFFKLQTTSVYEYLELRFGKATRRVASALCILQMVLSTSLVLYAPAIALNVVMGLSVWLSVLLIGFVCTFYSTIGGMKAVLWTDVFQSLLMFATVIGVIIRGAMDENGLGQVWNIATRGQRIQFFDFNPDPTARATFWTQMVGGLFTFVASHGVHQTQIQRLLTVRSLRRSQLAFILYYPILTFLSVTTSFAGLVIYSKYYDCDPVLSKRITSSDQLLPLFVMDYFSYLPGLPGLFVSGIFSAALSTVSSQVNSLAAVTLEDFIKPVLRSRWQSDKMLAMISKALACTFGILSIMLTVVIDQFGGVLQAAFTIMGLFGGPMLGLFTLGMFCPRCTQRGAITGFVIGLVCSSWIAIGASVAKPYNPILPTTTNGCLVKDNVTSFFSLLNITTAIPPASPATTPNLWERNEDILYLYRISFMWYAFLGFFAVILLGMLTSLCEKKPLVSPALLSPVCWYWYPSNLHLEIELTNSDANGTTKRNEENEHNHNLDSPETPICVNDSRCTNNL